MAAGRICACVQGNRFAPAVLSSAFLNQRLRRTYCTICFFLDFGSSGNCAAPRCLDSLTICPVCPETPGVFRGFIHALESQATAHRLRLQLCRTGMQRMASVTEWRTIQQVNATTQTLVASWTVNPFYFEICLRLIFLRNDKKPHLGHFGVLSANACNFALFQKLGQ